MKVSSSERIADTVFHQLRERIVRGELPPGTRLSVPAIADELEVSRSPVRDAVMRLTQERMARAQPRRGAVVAEVGIEELLAIYEVREVLEGLAARLAVENAGRRLVDRLREVLTEHERAVDTGDLEQHREIDMRFHTLVRRAGGNPEVIRLLDDIQTQIRLAMRTTTMIGGPQLALEDHRAVFAAIESGDPAEAERAARAHIARLRDALRESTEPVGNA